MLKVQLRKQLYLCSSCQPQLPFVGCVGSMWFLRREHKDGLVCVATSHNCLMKELFEKCSPPNPDLSSVINAQIRTSWHSVSSHFSAVRDLQVRLQSSVSDAPSGLVRTGSDVSYSPTWWRSCPGQNELQRRWDSFSQFSYAESQYFSV